MSDNKITKFFYTWQSVTRALEGALVDNIAATTPWLAPVIPAFLVYRNMVGKLDFPTSVAIVGAVVVEFLGLSTVHTTFMLWDYNDKKRKIDQHAPVWVSLSVAFGYIVIVLTVNVLLDGGTFVYKLAYTMLSLLSVLGAVTLAVRASHARRVADIAAAKKAARKRKVKEDAGKLPEVSKDSGDWRKLPEEDRLLVATMSTAQIADSYNVSDRTARSWRSKANNNK
jgi:hypothetical protein